jgi:hypothetical protein
MVVFGAGGSNNRPHDIPAPLDIMRRGVILLE